MQGQLPDVHHPVSCSPSDSASLLQWASQQEVWPGFMQPTVSYGSFSHPEASLSVIRLVHLHLQACSTLSQLPCLLPYPSWQPLSPLWLIPSCSWQSFIKSPLFCLWKVLHIIPLLSFPSHCRILHLTVAVESLPNDLISFPALSRCWLRES
jgi:hypothetical protein